MDPIRRRQERRSIRRAILAGGSVLGLFAASIVLLVVAGPDLDDPEGPTMPRAPVYSFPERTPAPEASATLTVFEDGCGVIRSEVEGEAQSLTWSIRDTDGFEVLGRNAAGETRYRYFQSGTYTVVLVAFHDGEYVPISNTVTIRC